MNYKNVRAEHKLPSLMKWFILYLSITVLLFFFGPVYYTVHNPALVITYLALYELALLLGYNFAEKQCVCECKFQESDIQYNSIDRILIHRLLLVGIVVTILLIFRLTGSLSIDNIISKIYDGITSPATRYAEFNENSQNGEYGSSLWSLLLTFGLPVNIAAITLSCFYFKKLPVIDKVLLFMLLFFQIVSKLIVSTNEGIFDIVIYISIALFLSTKVQNMRHPQRITKKNVSVIILLIVLAIIAFSYFSSNIIGRTQANFAMGTLGENYYNADAAINQYIPDFLFVTFVYFSVYICEGYYGFALSTTIDWIPNLGTGFSSFIRNNMSEILDIDLFQYSYQSRISKIYDWGALRNFHTAYTFWANDFGHIGVILVMFIIGYVFCKCYYNSIYNCSKTAIIMMPLLVTMLFYLPANNKIFIQPTAFLLVLYLSLYTFFTQSQKWYRTHYNKKLKNHICKN